VVGTRTYGKGVFQEIQPLSNGGALDFTIGEYFTPSGHNLGGGGVRRGAGINPNVYAYTKLQSHTDSALTAAEKTVAAELR
jgi:carboxyl-terminal processing protease